LIAFLVIGFVYLNKGNKDKPAIQTMLKQIDKAQEVSLNSKFRIIGNALNSYYSDHGEYPEILDLLVPNYLRSPQNLVDPWGTQFKLKRDEEMTLLVVSGGKDKVLGNEDDFERRL